jgi:hypothetical protein
MRTARAPGLDQVAFQPRATDLVQRLGRRAQRFGQTL